MNHPSEWTRFYDRGRYRYRHKGTGVIRDTLMSIGKRFAKKGKKKAEEATKKTAEKAVAKAVEKTAETSKKVSERGAEKIQQVLKRKKSLLPDSRKKLENLMEEKVRNPTKKLNPTSRKKLENILKREAMLEVNQSIAEN